METGTIEAAELEEMSKVTLVRARKETETGGDISNMNVTYMLYLNW